MQTKWNCMLNTLICTLQVKSTISSKCIFYSLFSILCTATLAHNAPCKVIWLWYLLKPEKALCMTPANCIFLTASCQPEELMTDITAVSVMLQHFLFFSVCLISLCQLQFLSSAPSLHISLSPTLHPSLYPHLPPRSPLSPSSSLSPVLMEELREWVHLFCLWRLSDPTGLKVPFLSLW